MFRYILPNDDVRIVNVTIIGVMGVSVGITEEEIDLLQSNDIQPLVIWNHTTDITGDDHSQNEANEANGKGSRCS
ncbi:hypothetical protein HNR44_003342 [Geomicrobium halophilum]|uniref:Uncharacterized protein n=1 Tax=Geomicrobium halophilum TaxID=549000 RepID=A0A841Q161_9BACL|nr:hypothetical protein [Geomicrobium halophilum]MBB6451335.1 hypothetical protein [Geomicrobium halophilum]